MNNHQIAKSNMYEKEELFFKNEAFSAIWANFTRLKDEITKYTLLRNQLTQYVQHHLLDTKGVTKEKNNALAAMIATVVNKANKAYVWALDTNNTALLQEFDVQKTDFETSSQNHAYAKAKNLRDAINANIESMASVELSKTDVVEINNAITAYEILIGTPATAKSHKQANTQGIEDIMHSIDDSLDIITRLITSQYTTSHPNLVKEFLIHRQIDELPTHHNGLSVTITNEQEQDLANALLSIEGTGKTALSDINGLAEIIKIKSGTYNVSITLANYSPFTQKLTIKKGKITKLAVVLKTL